MYQLRARCAPHRLPRAVPGLRRDPGAEAAGRGFTAQGTPVGARGEKKAWEDLGMAAGQRKKCWVGD